MNDFTEKLWPAFRAEVAEQLEAIELALVSGAPNKAVDVNTLFRHFHTVKGGCAMMGFANMGAVAHASEDALDPVRKGRRPLDETLVDALLLALDALKQQMEYAVQTRQDPPPREDIVARLRAEAGDQQAPAAVETKTLAVPPPAKGRRGRKSEPPPAAAASPADTVPDAQRFAATSREVLPLLLGSAFAPGGLSADIDAAAERLADAALDAGLFAIARTLSRRQQFFADGATRLSALGDLADRIAWLESTSQADCGTHDAARRLNADHHAKVSSAIAELAIAVAPLASPGSEGIARDVATRALVHADTVLACAQLLRLARTARLMHAAAQVLREVSRGAVGLNRELAELLVVASSLPAELHNGVEEDEPYEAMCAQILQRLQELTGALTRGTDLLERCSRIAARIAIRQDVLDTLLPQAVEALEAAIDRGETLIEIEADLESVPDGGQAFVAWLSGAGTIISNHTVFHRETTGDSQRQSTRLRFIAATQLPLADIKQALGDMDPDQVLFDLHHCARIATGNTVTVATETPSPGPSPAPVASLAAPIAASSPSAVTAPTSGTNTTLRIDSTTLDRFVNRVGEMVVLRNMMAHALGGEDTTARHRRLRSLLGNRTEAHQLTNAELDDVRALLDELDERHERLAQTDMRVQGALGRMQEDVLALRVVPIGTVFNRLPRVVRDLCQAQRKQASIAVSGEDVRIDKSLVDVLIEPFMHMVRNAVDHGIETSAEREALGKPASATLSLAARQQGNTLVVEVSDDGRGLNLARIREKAVAAGIASLNEVNSMTEREVSNLIFLPGFSTADRVTEVSGRGVGMDVVKTRILQVGGQIEVKSVAGRGTSFTLRLPLTAAIQSVILVACGSRQLAIPERNVSEVISIPASALQTVQGQACCLLRGANLPLYHLDQLLGEAPTGARTAAQLEVIVLTDGTWRIGVIVDRVVGRPEVFVRDIHPDLARLPGVGGASILGDGRVVIIVDTENLFELALRNAQSLRSLLRAS